MPLPAPSVAIAITPGSTEPVVVMGVAGDLALVRLRGDAHPVCAVQIGALAVAPGYERMLSTSIGNQVAPGPATLTWLGGQSVGGLAQVQLQQGGRPSPDVAAVAAGWAVPAAAETHAVLPAYRLAVLEAAHSHRGAWGDAVVEPDLHVAMQALLGSDRALYPSYVHAHPAFCAFFGLLGVIAVIAMVRRDHVELLEAQRQHGPIRTGFGYMAGSSLRHFASVFFTRRPPAERSAPPANRVEDP